MKDMGFFTLSLLEQENIFLKFDLRNNSNISEKMLSHKAKTNPLPATSNWNVTPEQPLMDALPTPVKRAPPAGEN